MKQRFSNIFANGVKHRGRAVLLVLMLVLIAVGGLFACTVNENPNGPAGPNGGAAWPQDVIAQFQTMNEQELRDYISQPIADGTVEEIAQQVVSQDMASYFLNKYEGGSEDNSAVIVDAEISALDLLGSFDQETSQPLAVYSPEYRLKPDDADKVVLAGARGLDEEGWIINSNMMNSRIMVTPLADGSYHFIACQAFDLPLDFAIREVFYGGNSAATMDFTISSDNFTYGLGRQVGDYPWNSGYNEGVKIIGEEKIENTDMPGTEFSRALLSTGHDDLGQTEMVWYQTAESGLKYIYSLSTTDPYVNCGYAGTHHARVGQTEAELLEGWGDVLSENSNIVYSDNGDDLCVFDQVYTYTAEVTSPVLADGNWTWQMNYYLNGGVITGVEMYMVMD